MTSNKNIQSATKNRDEFRSHTGFILACIGSAVGMGNIWRFPVMVSKYGGLTFILPFIIFVVIIAGTGVMEEFALGRAMKSGPIGAFGGATKKRFGNERIGKIIGAIPVLGAIGMAIGYTCVMAWIFKYLFMAITGEMYNMGTNTEVISSMFANTASAFGANIWVVVTIIACLAISIMGISNGIEKANKIMMPLLFGLLVFLAIYVATLPNSSGGYEYILRLGPAGLLDAKVWIFAFGQAFFSLSIAGNGSVIYGSYLSKKNSIPFSTIFIALFDVISAIVMTIVVIPAMATCGIEPSKSGPGIMFVYLVQVINAMPGGRIIGIVLFIAILFAGMSSIVNMYETPVSTLQDSFGINRKTSTIIILILGCVAAIFIQAITSEWMDAVSIYACPLGAGLAGIMFFIVCGKDFVLHEVNTGANKKVGPWFYYLGKYLFIPLSALALILGCAMGGIG